MYLKYMMLQRSRTKKKKKLRIARFNNIDF